MMFLSFDFEENCERLILKHHFFRIRFAEEDVIFGSLISRVGVAGRILQVSWDIPVILSAEKLLCLRVAFFGLIFKSILGFSEAPSSLQILHGEISSPEEPFNAYNARSSRSTKPQLNSCIFNIHPQFTNSLIWKSDSTVMAHDAIILRATDGVCFFFCLK